MLSHYMINVVILCDQIAWVLMRKQNGSVCKDKNTTMYNSPNLLSDVCSLSCVAGSCINRRTREDSSTKVMDKMQLDFNRYIFVALNYGYDML